MRINCYLIDLKGENSFNIKINDLALLFEID